MNCGKRSERESDHHSNEHYFSSTVLCGIVFLLRLRGLKKDSSLTRFVETVYNSSQTSGKKRDGSLYLLLRVL